jgi:large conductance mechanosensitive channel
VTPTPEEDAHMLREFRDFVARGNLVEIAVAFILGVAFATVVTAFTNVVLSLIAAAFGGDATFDRLTVEVNGTPIPYGAFLSALVSFVVVAWVLFLVVKAYNRFREAPDPTTKTCEHCKTVIPLAATRCPNCTSDVHTATA